MPLTIPDLKASLTGRKHPKVLCDGDLQVLADFAMRKMNLSVPLTTYSTFEGIADQQDYRIFDLDDDNTHGFANGSISVSNVYWNPAGDFTTMDLFNPGWQIIQQILTSGVYFHQPSQMMILREKLDAWRTQFGEQGFDIIGRYGADDSVLRIYPTPNSETNSTTVLVEYLVGGTLGQLISDEDIEYFWQWFDYYVSDTMAVYYAQTAGAELLGFSSGDKALAFWERRAKEMKEEAERHQRGTQGAVLRS